MRVTLNLATRPFADLGPAIKRLRIAMAVLAVLAIGLGLGLRALHQKAEEARAREHSLDSQIARITLERQQYHDMMQQPINSQVVAQAERLNKLFDEKAFSWTLAMEDLETVLPGGVQVSTLEPVRAKDGHITLHLRVIGPRNLAIDLVRNLEHSKRFLSPQITGENAEGTEGPNQHLEPVSASNRFDFDLVADYNPATPDERRPGKRSVFLRQGPDSQPLPHTVPDLTSGHHPVRVPYTGSGPANSNRTKPNPSLSAPGGKQ
jgi:type IV pilus assembly protein PilN